MMNEQTQLAESRRKSSQLVLVRTGESLVALTNLFKAIELQNSPFPELAPSTSLAVRSISQLAIVPDSYFLVLCVWSASRQTYVPFVSSCFDAQDDEKQTLALRSLLSKAMALGEGKVVFSTSGSPDPALAEVIRLAAYEILGELATNLREPL